MKRSSIYLAILASGMAANAYAACDTATVSGACPRMTLPSAAGNANYVLDSSAVVPDVLVNNAIGSLTNNGRIGSSTMDQATALFIESGAIVSGDVVNNGSIEANYWSNVVFRGGSRVNGNFVNNGVIHNYTSGGYYGVVFENGAIFNGNVTNASTGQIISESTSALEINAITVNGLNNAGLLKTTSTGWRTLGFYSSVLGSINNSGTITQESNNNAIFLGTDWSKNDGTNVTVFNNSGTISSTNAGLTNSTIFISAVRAGKPAGSLGSTIGTLTNTGSILAANGMAGVENQGSLGTLNNLQGSAGTALSIKGNLPTNYNIIVYSPTQYGQLAANGAVNSSMAFNIFGGNQQTGASTINARKYTGVLQGFDSGNIAGISAIDDSITGGAYQGLGTSGTYGSLTWYLLEQTGRDNWWDLLFVGASAEDTQLTLLDLTSRLQGTFAAQSAFMNYSLNHDCTVFDSRNLCSALVGSHTDVAASDTSMSNRTFVVAKKLNDGYRAGVFVDQSLSTGNVAGIDLGHGSPTVGVFGAWNRQADGLGLQVRGSAAYGSEDLTVTRFATTAFSEPGEGRTHLDTFGASVVASYGKASGKMVYSPYAGIRYTKISAAGYTEWAADGVTAPLTFARLKQDATTALLGVKLTRQFDDKGAVYGQFGLEEDLENSPGKVSATGLSGLVPVAFNPDADLSRSTAAVGAYYNIDSRQRIGADVSWSEQSLASNSTTSVMLSYTAGF